MDPANSFEPRDAALALPKGQQTRAALVEAALGLAANIGLEGLSIGALAELRHMSKSGVFAHFGSREELQISVIREYHERFADEVFRPALHHDARFLRRAGALQRAHLAFERILAHHLVPPARRRKPPAAKPLVPAPSHAEPATPWPLAALHAVQSRAVKPPASGLRSPARKAPRAAAGARR